MKGLLCCTKILGVLLFIPWPLCEQLHQNVTDRNTTATILSTMVIKSTNEAPSTIKQSPSAFVQTTTTTNSPRTSSTPTTCASLWTFFKRMEDSPNIIIICGALICTILLISTLALACKVCLLRRRLKTTGSDSEYWMGMDKTNKAELQPEAKENSFLLTENDQTNQETDNNATKEDGGKVVEDEQNGEKKEVGDSQESAEAAPTAAPKENSSSSKPEEEITSSETTIAPPPPSSSDDTEEPKKDP